LRQHLQEIERSPAPSSVVTTAVQQMQDVAKATFQPAFLAGKRQSGGEMAYVTPGDRVWIDRKLNQNHHYLATSLARDIHDKVQRLKLDTPGKTAESLDRAFGSRVEDLYGGQLWIVHEAGFRSGVDDIRSTLGGLGKPPLFQQDEGDEEDGATPPPRKKDRDEWALLALLLGIPRDTLLIVHDGLQIGVTYNTQMDARVCGSCDAAQGDYFPPQVSPLPGEVCDGFGNCRCFLSIVTRTV
jgi:hypothetical protein